MRYFVPLFRLESKETPIKRSVIQIKTEVFVFYLVLTLSFYLDHLFLLVTLDSNQAWIEAITLIKNLCLQDYIVILMRVFASIPPLIRINGALT